MIFWTHLPVRQWLHVEQDSYATRLHPHPWVVRNGMFIVARCSKQSEAESIVRDVELAFARAIARDIAKSIVSEETTDMTDLKKLIESAGKKFAEDVVAALLATQVGDLLDEGKSADPAEFIDKLGKGAPTTQARPTGQRKREKPAEVKPPKTKAQACEGQLAYWFRNSADGRYYAALPDASIRSWGRPRDLTYKLRKEGYTVTKLESYEGLTEAQVSAIRAI